MTGMSSLIGYTRLHVAHLSAAPFLTSVTGVLQLGHARISSNSGSTGMRTTIEHLPRFVEQFKRMKVAALVAALAASLVVSRPAAAQGQQAKPDRAGEAYSQFLLGHY